MGISVSRFEPLLPSIDRELESLSIEVYRQSAALGGGLHPLVRTVIGDLVQKVNCYYSNLIAGHHTRLADIDAALDRDVSGSKPDPRLFDLSIAYLDTEKKMRELLGAHPETQVCSAAFLSWLRREFYSRLPDAPRGVEPAQGVRRKVIPIERRRGSEHRAAVGAHSPQGPDDLDPILTGFSEAYSPQNLSGIRKPIAWAASHQRLAWIHPFLGENGHIARLFSTAYSIQTGVDAGGLWSLPRGLARNEVGDYKAMLACAAVEREGRFDGRWNLSEFRLREFCVYFLETALDQIAFMAKMFDVDNLKSRVRGFVAKAGPIHGIREEAASVLTAVLERGEVDRSEAARITGLGEREARDLLSALLAHKWLASPSPERNIRFAINAEAAEYYFPHFI